MLKKRRICFLISLVFMGSFLYAQSGDSGLHVKKSGSGERSIVFIPGLGCSGHVWDRTKQKLKK